MSREFSEKLREFQRAVVEWYRRCGDRFLPWRRTSDPWSVLVAAFLLRKTTVSQVDKIYEELMKKYPTPKALLSADEEELKELLRPLGIENQRSRHLKQLAERIEREFGGKVPCSKEELKELPGVGDYIAAEVLLASCGVPEPLLDRNMIRVIERVFGVKSEKKRPHTDPEIWSFAKSLVPENLEEAKQFNYGVLDLARKVCRARKPRCSVCPVKSICAYYERAKKA